MNHICAGIVVYQPDLIRLEQNIRALLPQVSNVLVFNNGTTSIKDLKQWLDEKKLPVTYLSTEHNRGIAAALNSLCKQALMLQFDWIVTMDQDSVASENMVEKLSEYANEDVAIVSPDICYRNNEQFSTKREQSYEDVEWTITSGSLTNLIIWNKIKGFDENLFIDYVDYDYCKRATIEGHIVRRVYEVQLLHELGNLKCRKIFGRTVYITNHSPKRRYYMMRNALIMYKRYHQKAFLSRVIKLYYKTIFFENNKSEGLRQLNKGLVDGLNNRMR